MSLEEALNNVEKLYGKKPKLRAGIVVGNKWDNVCYFLLSTYSICKELGCLPKAGGLDDQDYLTVHFFTIIAGCIAKNTRLAYGRAKTADHNRSKK